MQLKKWLIFLYFQELQESSERLNKKLHITDFVATVLLCLTIMNYTTHLQKDNFYFLNSHIESRLTSCLRTPSVGLNDALNIFRYFVLVLKFGVNKSI